MYSLRPSPTVSTDSEWSRSVRIILKKRKVDGIGRILLKIGRFQLQLTSMSVKKKEKKGEEEEEMEESDLKTLLSIQKP